MSKFVRIGMIAGGIILANVIYAASNPLASQEPCLSLCATGEHCGGPCPICFPNGLEPGGLCFSAS